MNAYLKIKIVSLAAESVLIRKAEQRIQRRLAKAKAKDQSLKGQPPQPVFFGLRSHRVKEVRSESRSACLAYGFLRGRSYEQIENKCWESPDWNRVEKLILNRPTNGVWLHIIPAVDNAENDPAEGEDRLQHDNLINH